MPNVCFQMIVFNSDWVLAECLESVRPFGPVIATEGPVDYWQRRGLRTSTDHTNQILTAYDVPTIHGQWAEKDEMVNAGLERVPAGTDFIWVLDSDEIWAAPDIRRVLAALETGLYDSVSFRANSYYGGFERVMGGFEAHYDTHRIQRWYPGATWATHRPPTIHAPGGGPWRDRPGRHLNGETIGVRFFHYSYVFPLQMQRKAEYYHDRDPGGTIPDYFERVYLPWVTGDEASRRAVEDEFDGVHNWLPRRRGGCRTLPAPCPHPLFIRLGLGKLQARFKRELAACRETAYAHHRDD